MEIIWDYAVNKKYVREIKRILHCKTLTVYMMKLYTHTHGFYSPRRLVIKNFPNSLSSKLLLTSSKLNQFN